MVVATLSILTITVFSIYNFVFSNKTDNVNTQENDESRQVIEINCDNEDTVYSMKRNPSGICLIINNYEVKGKRSRRGSEKDLAKLEELFTYLQFEVKVKKDKSADEIRQILNETRELNDLKSHDAFALIVMSHGDSDVKDPYGIILGHDGEPVTITEIFESFNNENCVNLRKKPKLFFFQSCRGGKRNLVVDGGIDRPLEKNTDIILSFSTVYNYESIRDVFEGSWYVTSLYNVFKNQAHNTEIEVLLRNVDKDVEKQVAGRRTQTTEYYVMSFRKYFYFNVNNNINIRDQRIGSRSA